MYTKSELNQYLKGLGINPKGTLKVHLSYKSIGGVEGGPQVVVDALMEFMKDGLLVLPAHTWDNVRAGNPVMDVLYTPTCVGVTTEIFRKQPGIHRSWHPTHSVAAVGEGAEEFVEGEHLINTPCGKGGTYYKLWERDAQILLIGVNFMRNTFIHGIEEWDGAVGILNPEFADYYMITPDGKRWHTPQYRHCSPLGSRTFTKLEPQALQEGILTLGRFGDATTRLMSARKLREMVAPLLAEDSEYLERY
ncbi:MAG: AAC(3) family N-acetyltransferase [Turicibacter sp.]|nr:AAC(3) family N-acetyltransferase [Turicibacter sp.]